MSFPEPLKLKVRQRAHFRCCLCHALGIEIHHIIPQSEGGPDLETNAAPLCPSCHDTYGANPAKRKFIREARDFWHELCERRFAQGSGVLARFEAMDNRLKGPNAARLIEDPGANILAFDPASEETAEFSGILSPAYRGTGIEVRLYLSSPAGGVIRWALSLRRNLTIDMVRDFAPARLFSVNSSFDSVQEMVAEVVFADGPEMDGLGGGDPFLLRVSRKPRDLEDTAGSYAKLMAVELYEHIR